MANNKLTAKQHKFALLVFEGHTQSDAYRQAYDAENMLEKSIHEEACILAANPKIASRIKDLQREVEAEAILSHSWIKAKLMENVTKSMQEEPVIDAEGNATGDFVYNGQVANKALELLGKATNLFDPAKAPKDGPVIDNKPTVSDADWAEASKDVTTTEPTGKPN